MSGVWSWWRSLWAGAEHPSVMAVIRVLVGVVFLYDLALVWQYHLITPLWGPGGAGGIGDPSNRAQVVELYRWFGDSAHVARWAFRALFGAVLCFTLGLFTRPMALLAVLIYAQLARVLPDADRGIDMLLRNVLFIYVFVPAGRFWGADARLFGPLGRIPAWPRRLIVLQLVVVYFTAGIQKTAVAWWPWGGFSALYVVLQDIAIARIPFSWLRQVYPVTQLFTAITMVFELLACLVPLAYWYRSTPLRAGWLRAQFNRNAIVTRWWLPMGVCLHVGIAASMQLGIFPWVMLALYPAFFHPDELARGWRRMRGEFGG